jgi:hypothetical protein
VANQQHQQYLWENLPPVLLTPEVKFAAGVFDNGGKFATGVVDTGGAPSLTNISANF